MTLPHLSRFQWETDYGGWGEKSYQGKMQTCSHIDQCKSHNIICPTPVLPLNYWEKHPSSVYSVGILPKRGRLHSKQWVFKVRSVMQNHTEAILRGEDNAFIMRSHSGPGLILLHHSMYWCRIFTNCSKGGWKRCQYTWPNCRWHWMWFSKNIPICWTWVKSRNICEIASSMDFESSYAIWCVSSMMTWG